MSGGLYKLVLYLGPAEGTTFRDQAVMPDVIHLAGDGKGGPTLAESRRRRWRSRRRKTDQPLTLCPLRASPRRRITKHSRPSSLEPEPRPGLRRVERPPTGGLSLCWTG
jgi:hypothetical protein